MTELVNILDPGVKPYVLRKGLVVVVVARAHAPRSSPDDCVAVRVGVCVGACVGVREHLHVLGGLEGAGRYKRGRVQASPT
jgi:hypothetical protein